MEARIALTALAGSTRPTAEAEEPEQRWEETERSGGAAGQFLTDNPFGHADRAKWSHADGREQPSGLGSTSANGKAGAQRGMTHGGNRECHRR